MSSETDRLGERVANIEGTVGQMNERIGAIEGEIDRLDGRMTERFDTLDGKIEAVNGRLDERVSEAERSIRRWIAIGLTLVTVALALVFGVLQVVL